jgi:hypothetical protein
LYNGLSSADVSEISNRLEKNYNRILEDLQVQDMPVVIVKIWANYDKFLNVMEMDIGVRYTGATGYITSINEFRLYYTNNAVTDAVHEFSHLVSMQINTNIPNNPRWLWEAVALYETGQFVNPKTLSYMVSGNYPTLQDLNTDYNSSNHSIYSVGFVLLEYIVDTWGMNTVIQLIRNNGNITSTLGTKVQEFESGWYQYVEEKYLN